MAQSIVRLCLGKQHSNAKVLKSVYITEDLRTLCIFSLKRQRY